MLDRSVAALTRRAEAAELELMEARERLGAVSREKSEQEVAGFFFRTSYFSTIFKSYP
jgi:hypothetical protein